MAIQADQTGRRRDQEGGRTATRKPVRQGPARRHSWRRLLRLLVPVRVVGRASRAPSDKVLSFEDGRVRVFVDPKSFLYLDGSTLEYATSMMGRGFKFVNPNVKGSCGCGESVQFLEFGRRPGEFMICWSCERATSAGGDCASCGAIQPPDPKADYFAVFGVDRVTRRLRGAGSAFRERAGSCTRIASPRPIRARVARRCNERAAERGLADLEGPLQARRAICWRYRA